MEGSAASKDKMKAQIRAQAESLGFIIRSEGQKKKNQFVFICN